MAIQITKCIIFLVTFQILTQFSEVECGFGKSFAGGIAGTIIGNAIMGGIKDKNHHHYYAPPQTTVERRETMANGCYRQVVKQPDLSRPGRYIESEQLICPPSVPAPVVPAVPVAPAPVAGQTVQYVPQQYVPPPPAGTVTILSTKTGSYRNSGISLWQTSSLVLVVACIISFIM